MELNTAAAVIKYVSSLELDSAELYKEWSKLHEKARDSFETFAGVNKKNAQNVKRAYYSSVSDALETGFCFKGFQSDLVIPKCKQEATISEILKVAIGFENEIKNFYLEAASLSKYLLTDISREMQRVAKIRENRVMELLSMSQAEES